MKSGIILKSNKDYSSKPQIKFGNYFFQWGETRFGLAFNEINFFKNFVKNIIPVLEGYMIFLQTERKNNNLANGSFTERKNMFVEEKYNTLISFLLLIDVRGRTVIYRQEKCDLFSDDDESGQFGMALGERFDIETDESIFTRTDSVEIKWILGELLFDRTKKSR